MPLRRQFMDEAGICAWGGLLSTIMTGILPEFMEPSPCIFYLFIFTPIYFCVLKLFGVAFLGPDPGDHGISDFVIRWIIDLNCIWLWPAVFSYCVSQSASHLRVDGHQFLDKDLRIFRTLYLRSFLTAGVRAIHNGIKLLKEVIWG